MERSQSNTYLTIYFYVFKPPHRLIICLYNYLDLSSPTPTGIILFRPSPCFEKCTVIIPQDNISAMLHMYFHHLVVCTLLFMFTFVQSNSTACTLSGGAAIDERVPVSGKALERSGRICCESISPVRTTL